MIVSIQLKIISILVMTETAHLNIVKKQLNHVSELVKKESFFVMFFTKRINIETFQLKIPEK